MIRLVARRGLSPAAALLAASLAACSGGTGTSSGTGLFGSSWMPYVSWPGETGVTTPSVAPVPPPAAQPLAPVPAGPTPVVVHHVPAVPPPQTPAHANANAYMVNLQTALNAHGAKLRVDGKCGATTRMAIRVYEKNLGVAVSDSASCQVPSQVWSGLGLSPGHNQYKR